MKQTKDICDSSQTKDICDESQTKICNNLITVAQADRYRLYMAGHAYIPCQDLIRYEKSFNLIYRK